MVWEVDRAQPPGLAGDTDRDDAGALTLDPVGRVDSVLDVVVVDVAGGARVYPSQAVGLPSVITTTTSYCCVCSRHPAQPGVPVGAAGWRR